MALDFPDAVERLAVLDIAPTATMYAKTNMEFARRYFWWFLPHPFPEEMIAGNVEGFLREHLARQTAEPNVFTEEVIQEYLRCYRDPATCHAICEDYRASATIDLVHDKASGGDYVTAPLLVLRGVKGTVGALYEVLQTWREKATTVEGHALNCGHALPAEVPQILVEEIRRFFSGSADAR